jgi:hypothetical protein
MRRTLLTAAFATTLPAALDLPVAGGGLVEREHNASRSGFAVVGGGLAALCCGGVAGDLGRAVQLQRHASRGFDGIQGVPGDVREDSLQLAYVSAGECSGPLVLQDFFDELSVARSCCARRRRGWRRACRFGFDGESLR